MTIALLIAVSLLILFIFLWRKAKDKYYKERVEYINKFTDQMKVGAEQEFTLLRGGYSIEKYKSELKYKLLEKLKKAKPSKSDIFHEMIMQFARVALFTFGIVGIIGTIIIFYQWIQRVLISGECTTYIFFEICKSE